MATANCSRKKYIMVEEVTPTLVEKAVATAKNPKILVTVATVAAVSFLGTRLLKKAEESDVEIEDLTTAFADPKN